MAVQDYKINYKSDFVLTINGDAGWTTQFCIKFWTGMPSQAYFVGFDGVKYVNCRVGDTPTQLLVMFDDHHLPIGPLKMQIAYHTTIEEFPGSVFDEVTNARDVIVTIDGTDYQVLLDFTGEDAPELEFDLPAYANEAERIQNELQRQQNEADRIAAELQREQATAAAVQGAENVNAQLNGNTLTVTNRQGVSTSVNTKGEQGEQGPVGPQGETGETGPRGTSIVSFTPKSTTATTLIYTVTFSDGTTQDVAIPKGAKGDTGATGPQGPQGDTGVSITGFVETGETETSTLYNITFSNGTTQAVAIPKGEKGDTGDQGPVGPQGPQGPMGDVAVITPEQQAAFTMYSEPGQNTNGPMTQKAVTDALGNIAASSVSYNNSESGLAADNVQEAVDELAENISFKQIPYDAQKNCALMGTQVSKWSYDRNYVRTHRVVQVNGEKYIKIVANNEYAPGIGFLKTYTQPTANNQPADFCDGYTATVRTGIGETQVLSIPSDCNYIVINCIYRASGINWNYEPIYVGLSVDAQEVYDEVETIDRDGLASGSLILDSIDYGYYYSDANGSKTSFQTANIDIYKVKGLVSQIHLTARIGNAMYSLFKDIEGNILGSFAGAGGQGMNMNQDISLPQGTVFVEISHSTTYPIYVYVLDRMVDAVIDLAAPANGLLQLTSTNEGHYISSPTGTISELNTLNIDYYSIIGTVKAIHIKARIGRAAYILLYDSSNNIISYVQGHDSSIAGINFDEYINISSNCVSFAVSYSTTVLHTIEVKKSLSEQIKEQETEVDYLKDKLVDFRGKKIGLLGDSIAANGGFITKACQLLGATFKNAAIGGWFLGNYENKSIYKQINGVSPATTQLDGDEDLIVIFAGTNDFGHSFTIGEPYVTDANGHRSYNTDANTTCGGLALAIQTLYTKYDGYIPIVICTPLQRSLAGTSSSGGSWDKNSINKYMDDYIDAILSVATYYGIPVCDFYNCNMNPNIPAANTLYFADGLHPNDAGHLIMGQLLANYLVNNAFTLS